VQPEAAAEAAADGSGASDGPSGDASDGAPPGSILVSSGSDQFETEDQIAVASDGTIGIAWTAFGGGASIGAILYAFSTNGGSSFTAPVRIPLPAGL